MKTGCYSKGMEVVTHPVYEGRDIRSLYVVLVAAGLLEITSLGQMVLGVSRTQMLIKGTNQEQTSFQNTRHCHYKHQLTGTFWVNLRPSG